MTTDADRGESEDRAGDEYVSQALPFVIGQRRIDTPGGLLIAEIAQNHEGSVGIAHSYIDAVADIGVDAIKFQTHIASAESTLDEPFRVPLRNHDASRFAYWKRIEFTREEWEGLYEHATRRGLVFLSSPFSSEAVDLLKSIGVSAWKLSSGEANSETMLRLIAGLGQPTIVSTGLSTWSDIDKSVGVLRSHKVPFALLQCTTRYPTPLEEVGLNVIDLMRDRYGCLVGLSDHSGSVWPGIAAIARGCEILEVHVTFDRRMFGPDQSVSLTIDELALLVEARQAISSMLNHPGDKSSLRGDAQQLKRIFAKSWTTKYELPPGTTLSQDLLELRKPGTGIPEQDIGRVVGRTLRRPATPNRLLRPEDLND